MSTQLQRVRRECSTAGNFHSEGACSNGETHYPDEDSRLECQCVTEESRQEGHGPLFFSLLGPAKARGAATFLLRFLALHISVLQVRWGDKAVLLVKHLRLSE